MAKPYLTLKNIHTALRAPRPRPDVYRDYNLLRQTYILNAAAAHFKMRDDDPAPLFNKTLLDVGCGESTIAEFLALSGAEITAIDSNAQALKKAQKSAEAFGAPITFVHTYAEQLVRSSRKFNIILALDLLEDTDDPAKLIFILKQLLAPGGIIIFSSISRTPRAWLYHIFLSGYIYGRTHAGLRSYWRFFTPAQLGVLCAQGGLKMSNVQGMRFSTSKQRWKFSTSSHTRYLATATAAR